MKTRFVVVVGGLVLMWGLLVVTTVVPSLTMAAEQKTLVEVHAVAVEKVKDNVFHVNAKGIVRTSGWVVNLHPVVYVNPPETWVIEAVGIKPTGVVMPVITAWAASVDMSLPTETREVSVKGINQTITEAVPW